MEITFSTKEVEEILAQYVITNLGEFADDKSVKCNGKSYVGLEATVTISAPVADSEE